MTRFTKDCLSAMVGRTAPIVAVMLLCSLAFRCPTVALAQAINDTWKDGDGKWNVAGNWTQGVPDNGARKNFNVSIVDGKSTVTTSGFSPTINNLTLAKSNTLTISNGDSLTIAAGAVGSGIGSISNQGTINLNSTNRLTRLLVDGANGAVSLTGGGSISLSAFRSVIRGASGTETLNNVNNTIQGGGRIDSLKLMNEATIVANSPNDDMTINNNGGTNAKSGMLEATNGGTLRLSGTYTNSGTILSSGTDLKGNASRVLVDSSVTNTGFLKATDGGRLRLQGTFTNTDGTILADGTKMVNQKLIRSTVTLYRGADESTINGGTLTTKNGGVIVSDGATLNGVTISARSRVDIEGGDATTLQGEITNHGIVRIGASAPIEALDGKGATFNNQTGGSLSLSLGRTGTIGTLDNQKDAKVFIDGQGTKLTVTNPIVGNGAITLTNGGKLDPPALAGSGQLALSSGSSATLGSYTMNTGGALVLDKTSLLQIGGDWSNQLKDPTQLQVSGKVELNGGGSLQQIEVAGRDFGNTLSANAPAFSNNFNIGSAAETAGTLQIDSGSHLMLVDRFDNGNQGGIGSQIAPGIWTGSPTGSEALYVWNLVIQPDVTIDFDGLHLYYETGPSHGFGPDPSVWLADLAAWQAQGDVFVGGEPFLIPIAMAASVAEPSSFVLIGTALAALAALAWIQQKKAVASHV